MKYDLSKTPTKGAQRTLKAFSEVMFLLISEKSFEEISANEICDRSGYPRATFYNYFDDKYDLLNYCWLLLSEMIRLDEYEQMNPSESMYIYFDRIYNVAEENSRLIQRILNGNTETGYMFNSFKIFMGKKMRETFQSCPLSDRYPIPKEIVADHYSNTLLLVLEWVFWNGEHCSKETAHQYLRYLLRNL